MLHPIPSIGILGEIPFLVHTIFSSFIRSFNYIMSSPCAPRALVGYAFNINLVFRRDNHMV